MNKPNKLTAHLASALTVAALFGTSAFAESRHHQETHSGSSQRSTQSRPSGNWNSSQSRQSYQRSAPAPQYRSGSSDYRSAPQYRSNTDYRGGTQYRSGATDYRSGSQYRNGGTEYRGGSQYRGNESWRGGSTNRSYSGSYGRGSYGGHSVVGSGRVSRILHEGGGYRVWLDGGRYAYWLPEARFNLFPLRVGLSVNFGGYWDPLGYWNVYDVGPIGGPYYTSGDLRGVVESVDFRSGTVELRDDASGSFVTVVLSGDPRMGDLRPGDYVDVAGAWTRNGVFSAERIDLLRDGYPQGGNYVQPY